jgi:hypothetical protein
MFVYILKSILAKSKEDTLEAVQEAKRQGEVDESSIFVQERSYHIRGNLSFSKAKGGTL